MRAARATRLELEAGRERLVRQLERRAVDRARALVGDRARVGPALQPPEEVRALDVEHATGLCARLAHELAQEVVERVLVRAPRADRAVDARGDQVAELAGQELRAAVGPGLPRHALGVVLRRRVGGVLAQRAVEVVAVAGGVGPAAAQRDAPRGEAV